MDGRATRHPSSSQGNGGQQNPLFSSRPIKHVDAARDVWFSYIHRSLVASADWCKDCTEAGKNFEPMCVKGDIGKIYESREPNECLQLDCWGPIKYLKESDKYVLVAVDRFSRWSSAMICGNNRSDKVLKFMKQYISQHGVP